MKKISDELVPVAAQLTRSANDLTALRLQSETAWNNHKLTIKDAHEKGLSLDQIASLTGVTKSRIWQVVTGRKK